MTADRVIGSGDGMPWDVPSEYQQYLQQVAGNTIVMGRRSFEIFGADLAGTGTQVFVVSRTQTEFTGAAGLPSLEQAIAMGKAMRRPIFIGGGASVYAAAIPLADRMHLSTIDGQFEGDTFFPEFDASAWSVALDEQRDGYRYREFARA